MATNILLRYLDDLEQRYPGTVPTEIFIVLPLKGSIPDPVDICPSTGLQPACNVARQPNGHPLRMLPKESGIALMGFGMVGVLMLDPVDLVFVLAGALAFSPRLSRRVESWVQGRFPRVHRKARRQIDRFIDDFERRYPPPSR
jgi:hypothetical protein